MIKVNQNNRCFEKNGEPFFYLADTIWSAFTNVTLEEWEYYLAIRKHQGFNVLQINTLAQWDRSPADGNLYPFEVDEDGRTLFERWNEEYFKRARLMCQMAAERGFELALVLLWSNYVPDTWASKLNNHDIIPESFLEKLVEKQYEVFDEFQPIYIISGDTDFDTERCISYYDMVLAKITGLSPNTLKTLHIKGRLEKIPERFVDRISFYMYQSGHNAQNPAVPYEMAQKFYNSYPGKPVLNAEPCYEQMGYSRRMYGRFTRRDIRRAAWMSVLSGACCGITYGAHGIWSWHKTGKTFASLMGEGFDAPMAWEDAIKLRGAWDYGYIKYLFQVYELGHLVPVTDICENNTEDIRVARTEGAEKIVIYVPVNTTVRLAAHLREYEWIEIDLCNKDIFYPDVIYKAGKSMIQMHNMEEDVLIIGKRFCL